MEKYLNKGIKDLISEFPKVGDILNEYNIGCVPCSVGSCLLKDIVQIHNLSSGDEEELIARIARVIYPGRKIKIPKVQRKAKPKSKEMEPTRAIPRLHSGWLVDGERPSTLLRTSKVPSEIEGRSRTKARDSCGRNTERPEHIRGLKAEVLGRECIKYSPPLKRLVDEHILIKKWIRLIPTVIKNIDIESESDRRLIIDGMEFIKYYADGFHHAKEEDILFEYTDKNLDIIKAILQDHETARGHVRAIFEGLKTKDKESIIEHLNGYKDLLTEHIKKEDEILYPWIDRNLSTKQVGELFSKFDEAEEKIDKEVVEKCKRFVVEETQRIEKIKQEVLK